MIDHLTLRVRDLESSKAFYLAALAPLGYELVMEFESPKGGKYCGLGVNKKPDFWIAQHEDKHPAPRGQHIAFRARERKQVDAFHKAALGAGAQDDGAPGPRKEYHPNYYGAFVIDLNGIHLEACKHESE
jgi:catechol 2,3-dioxygenase-like lactoylglutathione lyase family enzyme